MRGQQPTVEEEQSLQHISFILFLITLPFSILRTFFEALFVWLGSSFWNRLDHPQYPSGCTDRSSMLLLSYGATNTNAIIPQFLLDNPKSINSFAWKVFIVFLEVASFLFRAFPFVFISIFLHLIVIFLIIVYVT